MKKNRPKKLGKYRVKVSYTFNGYMDIRAESKKDAVAIATTAFDDPPKIVLDECTDYSPGEEHQGVEEYSEFKLDPKLTHIR